VILNIAYRGNHQPHLDEHNRTSTEHQVAATLEAMGHKVWRLQEDAVDWDIVSKVAADCDLFLWTQTRDLDPLGARRTLHELSLAKVPTVSFHLDLYFGLARAHQVDDFPFWQTDHVFTADGGHQDEFERRGIDHHWMTPAIYEPEAVLGERNEEDRWPIIFVGSYPYPHPEHAEARKAIVNTVQARYGPRFRLYRSGYRGRRLGELIAGSEIVIGDSCLAGHSFRYWSDRIPETLGRGGFLIHPYVEGIEEHYTDGEHLRFYEPGDMAAMVALMEFYLAHPVERARIAAAGRAHVLAHHTYRHRMDELLTSVLGTPELSSTP
jgi:hypothetical protein